MRNRFAILCLSICFYVAHANSATHVMIVCGSGGQPEYQDAFATWGRSLSELFISKFGYQEERVSLFLEAPKENDEQAVKTSLGALEVQINRLSQTLAPEDQALLILIGHGSHIKKTTRFHIPGPDITSDTLDDWLGRLQKNKIILIASTPSSAGFINALSAKNRILCAATKSVEQANATQFMQFFIEALKDGSADLNRDARISVLEACSQASAMTQAWYKTEGLLASENALLDDNGDKLGTRIPFENSMEPSTPASEETPVDGALASECFIKDYVFPKNAPPALIDRYLTLMERVGELKKNKHEMEEGFYYFQLEDMLIKAAKTHREIRKHSAANALEDEPFQAPAQPVSSNE